MGLRVAEEVNGLRALSGSVSDAGAAVEQTGQSLGRLDLPFLDARLESTAEQITTTGRDVRTRGLEARESIADLSTLLGLSVALDPSSFLLIAYLPARIAQIRASRAAGAVRVRSR